jgi:hypothetical protein
LYIIPLLKKKERKLKINKIKIKDQNKKINNTISNIKENNIYI